MPSFMIPHSATSGIVGSEKSSILISKPTSQLEIFTILLSVIQQGICLLADERVTAPWDFQVFDTIPGSFTPAALPLPPSIPDFGLQLSGQSNQIRSKFPVSSGCRRFERSTPYCLSGAKFEDSDLSGSSIQPGVRMSYTLDEQNIFGGIFKGLQTSFPC